MSFDANVYLDGLFIRCNRIVITAGQPFNPKKRTSVEAIADVRDLADLESAKSALRVDPDSGAMRWMSPVEMHINFMRDKALVEGVGIVLGSWLRIATATGDHALANPHVFDAWLERIRHAI